MQVLCKFVPPCSIFFCRREIMDMKMLFAYIKNLECKLILDVEEVFFY